MYISVELHDPHYQHLNKTIKQDNCCLKVRAVKVRPVINFFQLTS
jgi:hypothetical protein